MPYLGNILVDDFVDIYYWSIHARVELEGWGRLVDPRPPVDKVVEVRIFPLQFAGVEREPLNVRECL